MSGLEVAAAVIGITDFALRGIKGLYDLFRDLQDAREKLPHIWNEVSYLQNNLSSLEFLSKADEDTLKEVKATGITQGMNDCGSACDKFVRQLTRWTKGGVDSFIGKLKFKLHSAQVEKTMTRLWATARMLDMTVGILTLYYNSSFLHEIC
jgi:Fungal N-terminal domain of STAND proteins